MPLTIQTILFATLRHRLLPVAHRHYGSTFRLRMFPGRPVVCLADPDDIRAVLNGPVTTFHAGEGNLTLKPVMGEHSLMTTDEDQHRRIRRLLMPAFNGAALRGYREMVAQLAEKEVASWPVGEPFNSHESMQRLTLEIILRVVFGVDVGPRLTELRREVCDFVSIDLLDLFGLLSPKLQRFGRWRRKLEQRKQIDELLRTEIASRRTASDLAERTDVLSRLLSVESEGDALTEAELRDQLVTLLLAGHETTATALAWAFHELARSESVQAAGRRAAERGDDKYLEAIAKEAMRLRPVINELARIVAEPVVIGGYRIDARTTVTPLIGVVQADPNHHEAPEQFRPERFLDGSTASNTWLPFGGGARRCLGAGFSLLEATEVLRAVLDRYHIAPFRVRPEPIRPRHITLAPGRGARIIVTPC